MIPFEVGGADQAGATTNGVELRSCAELPGDRDLLEHADFTAESRGGNGKRLRALAIFNRRDAQQTGALAVALRRNREQPRATVASLRRDSE